MSDQIASTDQVLHNNPEHDAFIDCHIVMRDGVEFVVFAPELKKAREAREAQKSMNHERNALPQKRN